MHQHYSQLMHWRLMAIHISTPSFVCCNSLKPFAKQHTQGETVIGHQYSSDFLYSGLAAILSTTICLKYEYKLI